MQDWLTFAASDPPNPWRKHDLVFVLAMGCHLNMALGRLAEAHTYRARLVSEAERLGHKQGQIVAKVIAGQLALASGDPLAEARENLESALALFDSESFIDPELGWERVFPTAMALVTLSRMAGKTEDFDSAYRYVGEALNRAWQLSIPSFSLMALAALSEVLLIQGQLTNAAELARLIQSHPSSFAIDKDTATHLLRRLKALLAPEDLTVACERGRGLDLESVVAEFLAQRGAD